WSDFQLEKLYQNWRGRGMYVLVAKATVPKSPSHFLMSDIPDPATKIHRMLRALRIANDGDVHIGSVPMIGVTLSNRPAGSGFTPNPGAAMEGQSARWVGVGYTLRASDSPRIRQICGQLAKLDATAGRLP